MATKLSITHKGNNKRAGQMAEQMRMNAKCHPDKHKRQKP
jgi:hypothetical protein